MNWKISHHGAVDGVTGSCHELKIGRNDGVLVDCGLFQGKEASKDGANFEKLQIEFPIEHIRALLVTHCHIDHVGRIPYLLAAGFSGPIICSKPTAQLLPLVLRDAVELGITRDQKLIEKFLNLIEERIIALDYQQWFDVPLSAKSNSLRVRFSPAGHVLGSAYIECEVKSKSKTNTIVFSGDLGATITPILVAPNSPPKADVLILESTYGDRNHNGRESRQQALKSIVEHCFRDRGAILIPAFSIGRTQELLYEFEQIIHEFGEQPAHTKGKWSNIEVVIDSPLACRFTEVYQSLQAFWDKEAKETVSQGRHPLSFDQMTTIDSYQDHLSTVKYLEKTGKPTVVIAASGMCAGGRIINYLKSMLGDHRTDVLFMGYQAEGTPGRDIQRYGPRGGYVELDGKKYDIKAQIHTLNGYSAHADQQDLLSFVAGIEQKPQEIRLVHGDNRVKQVFRTKLQECFPEIDTMIPCD